jgi:hypothetical protein
MSFQDVFLSLTDPMLGQPWLSQIRDILVREMKRKAERQNFAVASRSNKSPRPARLSAAVSATSAASAAAASTATASVSAAAPCSSKSDSESESDSDSGSSSESDSSRDEVDDGPVSVVPFSVKPPGQALVNGTGKVN